MLVKVLNKLGLYTRKQYLDLKFYNEALETRFELLLTAYKASEDAEAKAIKENEKLKKEIKRLKLKVARNVKRRKR